MTGRNSDIVLKRAEELEIRHVLQSVKNKRAGLERIAKTLRCDMGDIAYIGDDINDLEAMSLCGVKGCPADAVEDVKKVCDFVSGKNGGEGAVRDFIDWLAKKNFWIGEKCDEDGCISAH